MTEFAVVVPWHNPVQRDAFVKHWGLTSRAPEFLIMQQDAHREGCAVTKNKGVKLAVEMGADVVIVLDDDCYPEPSSEYALHGSSENLMLRFAQQHIRALEAVDVELFATITHPPSRGTPYLAANRTIQRCVAASVGFWTNIGDYCAARQLAFDGVTMMRRFPIFECYRYFALSGMNIAFRPKEWMPWCQFIDVARYDDIWMGWLWQREAYRRGAVFALNGPEVRHSRQSNVWRNLQDEARFAEINDTLWRKIALAPDDTYDELRKLLPV